VKIIDTAIPDVKIIEPAVFGDERGFFLKVLIKPSLKSPLDTQLILFKIIIHGR
jgi:dTDP-4-dehydrorhamnose 3,5-epimerase-like enzyme